MNRKVYADNAATTAVSPQVLEAMLPFYKEVYGNPSSLYALGQEAKRPREEARATVARCLGAEPREIYFTSCGTESDNWAIKGAARAMKRKGKNHIITSAFEHHAVLHTCQALEKEGFTVTYLDVHEDGIVRPQELEEAMGRQWYFTFEDRLNQYWAWENQAYYLFGLNLRREILEGFQGEG